MERLPAAAADYRWYFAYGSNLSKGRMADRTGCVPEARTAWLPCYRLAFNLCADEAIYANIVPCSPSLVWGAAYWCSRAMMRILDGYEGVANGCYRRATVEVEAADGARFLAETYIGGESFVNKEGQPGNAYLSLILAGGREHCLPADYIDFVEACRT
jgi:gamma-glutamylcyclotransferase